MVFSAMGNLGGTGLLALASDTSGGSFMDTLPDPMKLQLPVVAFVVVLLALLFFFLKTALFKPLTKVMDSREAAIQAGGSTKAEAAAQVETRQAEYATRLKTLRAQAFEHRKSLTAAVTEEKQAILDTARQDAVAQRNQALEELRAQQKAAEVELRAQVDALSESMVQHLLKQA